MRIIPRKHDAEKCTEKPGQTHEFIKVISGYVWYIHISLTSKLTFGAHKLCLQNRALFTVKWSDLLEFFMHISVLAKDRILLQHRGFELS